MAPRGFEIPAPGGGLTRWTGLAESSPALAAAAVLHAEADRFVFVCPREADASEFLEDLKFFLDVFPPKRPVRCLSLPARPSDFNIAHVTEPHIGWERVSALHQLLQSEQRVAVVTSLLSLAQRTIPKDVLIRSSDILMPGAEVDRDDLARSLVLSGYDREPLVEEPGTFAVRGGIVDVFPPHLDHPFRLELSGDRIESIRRFDSSSQRSMEEMEEATFTAAREVVRSPTDTEAVLSRLKDLADSLDIPRNARAPMDTAIREGRYTEAMDALLPVFYGSASSIFDYAPATALWIAVDPFSLSREAAEIEGLAVSTAARIRSEGLLRSLPDDLSLPGAEALTRLRELARVELSDATLEGPMGAAEREFNVKSLSDLRGALIEGVRKENPLRPLLRSMEEWREAGLTTIFSASTQEESRRIHRLLSAHVPDVRMCSPSEAALPSARGPAVITGRLSRGFRLDESGLVFITGFEIFGKRKHSFSSQLSRDDALASLRDLSPGDAVVHIDFGVGIYRGLQRLTAGGVPNDFLHIEYDGGDKLYLPVHRLNRVQRYIGADGNTVKLDRLGNPAAWARTKEKARRAVDEMAQELVTLYAARKVAKGHALGCPDEGYLSFEAEFPYEETPDQRRTIEEVSADLEAERPMDRLVCGDVGFGKTEVALRAAFRVAMAGKQVAVLVPTTVLAQQHFETFSKRFRDTPLRVEYLSRFKSAAEQKATAAGMESGSVDIVIGTHRLLSADIAFRDLGLLVIDEEHRFGVRHKEKIRAYRTKVDVISLTATPIPRTLQMSVSGIRDLSVINTPPLDRKAIGTYLCRFDDAVIQGAIRKELARGGQVFFVHNRIETIHEMGTFLSKLVPQAAIGIAHGQMSEDELEMQMVRFVKREFDVLLCTTIIESGLDIPSANTIIINRADKLGLAQLYQLRGRVGRSDREAYAYLLVPGEDLITRTALKRLKVLKRFTELGSGLKIALHDLEIRGAGNLLGPSQSGHIKALGLELYLSLLEHRVRQLKGEAVEDDVEPEIHCNRPAYLPEDYVASTGERLVLYKRLSSIRTEEELRILHLEIKDRFGAIPPTVENLIEIIGVKIVARRIGVRALRMTGETPGIDMGESARVNLDRLFALIKKDKRIVLHPDNRIVLKLNPQESCFEETKRLLEAIA